MARRRSRNRGQQSWTIWFKLLKFTLLLGAFGATGFYAYEVGQRLALEEVGGLRQEIERLTAAEASRAEEAGRLKAELADTRKRADEYQAKFEQVNPSDEMKEMMGLVRGKLDSGFDPKRLAFVIQAAERPRRCGTEDTKRFMVRTPSFDNGTSTWVRFSDLITVSAEGVGGEGGKEQWFDPEKSVTVRFTAIGGKEAQIQGKLPLQHSMVVKGGEYRFTVAPGARGFVEVTGDRCEYRG